MSEFEVERRDKNFDVVKSSGILILYFAYFVIIGIRYLF